MSRNLDNDVDLDAIATANDAVQDWITENGEDLPEDFLHLLADLDHVCPTWLGGEKPEFIDKERR